MTCPLSGTLKQSPGIPQDTEVLAEKQDASLPNLAQSPPFLPSFFPKGLLTASQGPLLLFLSLSSSAPLFHLCLAAPLVCVLKVRTTALLSVPS